MKTNLSRLKLTNLRNSEYSMFVNQFISILLKYQPELLHLQRAFEKLTALLPDLAKIKAQELSNTLSTVLHELDDERDSYLNAMAAQVKIMGRLKLPSIASHVAVITHFLDIHGRDISKANYNAKTEQTNDLLNDYISKEDVVAAVDELNLKILFDQLSIVNAKFAELFLQRVQEEAAIEKVDARAIRTETGKVMVEFCEAFEFCSMEYTALDYLSPAKELNDLIGYYKTQLKARTTRRKSGKEVSNEAPIAEPSEHK